MREIFAGILLMFAVVSLSFADESPDWDVSTVSETQIAAVSIDIIAPDRSYTVTGGDHALIAKTATIDGGSSGMNCKYNCSSAWVPQPFEVGWRSS